MTSHRALSLGNDQTQEDFALSDKSRREQPVKTEFNFPQSQYDPNDPLVRPVSEALFKLPPTIRDAIMYFMLMDGVGEGLFINPHLRVDDDPHDLAHHSSAAASRKRRRKKAAQDEYETEMRALRMIIAYLEYSLAQIGLGAPFFKNIVAEIDAMIEEIDRHQALQAPFLGAANDDNAAHQDFTKMREELTQIREEISDMAENPENHVLEDLVGTMGRFLEIGAC